MELAISMCYAYVIGPHWTASAPFHGGNRGSNPLGDASFLDCWSNFGPIAAFDARDWTNGAHSDFGNLRPAQRDWSIHIPENPAQMVKRPASADRKRSRVFRDTAPEVRSVLEADGIRDRTEEPLQIETICRH